MVSYLAPEGSMVSHHTQEGAMVSYRVREGAMVSYGTPEGAIKSAMVSYSGRCNGKPPKSGRCNAKILWKMQWLATKRRKVQWPLSQAGSFVIFIDGRVTRIINWICLPLEMFYDDPAFSSLFCQLPFQSHLR